MKKPNLKHLVYLVMGLIFFLVGCETIKKHVVKEKTDFLTIGTGGINALYYPIGSEIAKILNNAHIDMKATAKTSYNASEYNIVDVLNGDLKCGIAQADDLITAQKRNPNGKNLRALFSLHTEAITLLATGKSGIKQYKDLKGKKVRTGTTKKLNHDIKEVLLFAGLKPKEIKSIHAKSVLCPNLIQTGKIDAYFFTVGHPNDNTEAALAGKNKVNIIPLAPDVIKKITKTYPYYIKTAIPLSYYTLSAKKINTVGVKSIFFTSENLSEDEVYKITKAVFSNLKKLILSTPALQNLKAADMLKGLQIPIHKGALKYYKEIGLIRKIK